MDINQKKQIFNEITWHLLNDDKPSLYMNSVSDKAEFNEHPFRMLILLKTTEQSAKYHPEGNVWNHTMLVIDEAAKVRINCEEPEVFMWAALLHDIGKPKTTRVKKDRITSYDHDKEGEKLSIEFLKELTEQNEFIGKVSALVRYHMHILYILKNLPYADKAGLLSKVNVDEIALLCKCDRLGRSGVDIEEVEQEYREFLNRLKK
jgi:putative nucleotidyltransferase with HDIG domain